MPEYGRGCLLQHCRSNRSGNSRFAHLNGPIRHLHRHWRQRRTARPPEFPPVHPDHAAALRRRPLLILYAAPFASPVFRSRCDDAGSAVCSSPPGLPFRPPVAPGLPIAACSLHRNRAGRQFSTERSGSTSGATCISLITSEMQGMQRGCSGHAAPFASPVGKRNLSPFGLACGF